MEIILDGLAQKTPLHQRSRGLESECGSFFAGAHDDQGRGKFFYRLMQQAVNTSPRSYESMVKPFREKLLHETPQDGVLAE